MKLTSCVEPGLVCASAGRVCSPPSKAVPSPRAEYDATLPHAFARATQDVGRVLLSLAIFTFASISAFAGEPTRVASEALVLTGEVTNTTHNVSAPVRFELTFADGKITGFMTVEPPLMAGRWPVEGERRGAWCEIVCRQTEDTKTVFQGVLSETSFRASFVVGGGGNMVEYGRVQASVTPQP